MSIPDFQTIMLPFLKRIGDQQEHQISNLIEILAGEFGLTEEERQELLPSGKQERFSNRVHWARQYLLRAGLLESTGRGKIRINNKGLSLLLEAPPAISIKLLSRYPGMQEFHGAKKDLALEQGNNKPAEGGTTPDEKIEVLFNELRKSVAQDLIVKIKSCTPAFFERLVIDLLVAMGYGGSRQDAGQAVGRSGDGGIDGIIKEDRLGLDVIYIQAKRWENPIGRPAVQAFAGSLEGFRARKGVLITTSCFSSDAKEYVTKIEKKIVLIDGEQLAEFMIDFGIGVTEVNRYIIKKIDSDYFEEI